MSPAKRLVLVLAVLTAALIVIAASALFVGSAAISPRAVLNALAGRAAPESVERVVTLSIRLPRIVVAALAGGALAVAGVAFQALTRNPLAEPSVLGVYLIAAIGRELSIQTLLLAGVIVGIFFSAAITVIISFLDLNRLGGVIHWLLGNLAPIPARALVVFALCAGAGFWLVASHARELNLMALGEETALLLGVGAARLKLAIFVGAALLTASVVAFAGPIGFVGLIVPHALRMLLGSDNRLLVPASLVGGGIFLLLADTLARNVVAPAELSVGVITALCGAPFFVYLLRTRYRPNL